MWELFAHIDKNERFAHTGSKRYVQMCGSKTPVPVTVTEDPEGDYHGWIRINEETKVESTPVMIYPQRFLLEMCFPMGDDEMKSREAKGEGRVVRLAICERKKHE